MDVLQNYDNQVSKYIKEINPIVLPLLSWDMHMTNLNHIAKLKSDVLEINKITNKLNVDVNLVDELINKQKVIVITDLNLNIEFTSSNTTNMTGYLPSEVIGNTPKMFQGPATEKELSKKIRNHVNARETFEVTLTNYKKNKSVYSCHLKGYPVFDKKGKLVKYVAVEAAA